MPKKNLEAENYKLRKRLLNRRIGITTFLDLIEKQSAATLKILEKQNKVIRKQDKTIRDFLGLLQRLVAMIEAVHGIAPKVRGKP